MTAAREQAQRRAEELSALWGVPVALDSASTLSNVLEIHATATWVDGPTVAQLIAGSGTHVEFRAVGAARMASSGCAGLTVWMQRRMSMAAVCAHWHQNARSDEELADLVTVWASPASTRLRAETDLRSLDPVLLELWGSALGQAAGAKFTFGQELAAVAEFLRHRRRVAALHAAAAA